MPRDNQKKMSKINNEKMLKKKQDNHRLKRNSDNDESSDSEGSYASVSDDDEMDVHEYRKFLSKIFPSKHLDKKIKDGEMLKNKNKSKANAKTNSKNNIKNNPSKSNKKTKCSDSDSDSDDSSYEPVSKKKTKIKKVIESESESESESEETLGSEDTESEWESEDDDEDEDEDEEEDDNKNKKKNSKYNIVFTIGGNKDEEYEYDDEYDSSSSCEDSNDTENEDDILSASSSDEDVKSSKKSKLNKNTKKEKKSKKEKVYSNDSEKESNDSEKEKIESNDSELISILKKMKCEDTKDNVLVNECIKLCENKVKGNKKKQEKLTKLYKERNSRIFKRILRDKNTMNDYEFFDNLQVDGQKKLIKELREINKATRIEKPYRLTLLESDIPVGFKGVAMKKISSLRNMDPENGEYHKIHNWVTAFMRIPFGNYNSLPIHISDGKEKCHDFMENAKNILDEAVYGLNDAKMQIMQMLGQFVTNPNAIGSAIAIHGPPGTGKTSLVKEGISKILNRPFAFIALGGATDSSFLEGHGYTYEGSTWGKIVQILIDSKCMNPVIYFDELDKISDTPKGEEIAGILTHLTDSSQNSQFHDKYFSEIDFDLSKCLFIFSYNDESKINPILRDRMYRIQTAGYSQKEKSHISNNYLLPRIREQVKFEDSDIIIPETTISYVIENYCNSEDGVRNLKRCLEIIYTKLNLYRLMKPGSNLFEKDTELTVEFPFTVTTDIVNKLIKTKTGMLSPSLYGLYC